MWTTDRHLYTYPFCPKWHGLFRFKQEEGCNDDDFPFEYVLALTERVPEIETLSMVAYSEPQIVRVPRVMVDTLCERQLHDNVEMHCLHEIVDALTVALERFNGDSDTHSKFQTIKQDLETAISNTQASCSKMRILLRNKMMKKELVEVAWAPERHIPWCLDEEEKNGL